MRPARIARGGRRAAAARAAMMGAAVLAGATLVAGCGGSGGEAGTTAAARDSGRPHHGLVLPRFTQASPSWSAATTAPMGGDWMLFACVPARSTTIGAVLS